MKKILIVEDEVNIYKLIKFNLENMGFEVIGLQDGSEVMNTIERQNPNLVILDLMLPKKDGITLCREIRGNKDSLSLPIIILTAKSEELDRILGLEMGADDYMTKPFSVKELCARVKAVLRRTDKQNDLANSEDVIVGDLHIIPSAFEVYKGGKRIILTLKEYEVLLLLAKNKNKVLTRDRLLDEVWGYEYYGETRTVDVHIRYLRKKLETENVKYIETVRGVGYRLIDNI